MGRVVEEAQMHQPGAALEVLDQPVEGGKAVRRLIQRAQPALDGSVDIEPSLGLAEGRPDLL